MRGGLRSWEHDGLDGEEKDEDEGVIAEEAGRREGRTASGFKGIQEDRKVERREGCRGRTTRR